MRITNTCFRHAGVTKEINARASKPGLINFQINSGFYHTITFDILNNIIIFTVPRIIPPPIVTFVIFY